MNLVTRASGASSPVGSGVQRTLQLRPRHLFEALAVFKSLTAYLRLINILVEEMGKENSKVTDFVLERSSFRVFCFEFSFMSV